MTALQPGPCFGWWWWLLACVTAALNCFPLLCAVAVKIHGAKEAEGDGGCGNRAALGSAAVPEAELLLHVSAAPWQMP